MTTIRRQAIVPGTPEAAFAAWPASAGPASVWPADLRLGRLASEPPHRLVLAADAGRVEVTFVGVARGSQTLVTVSHDGWNGDRDECRTAWRATLDSLAEALPAADGLGLDGPVWLVLSHTLGPAGPTEGSVYAHPLFREHIAFLQRLAALGVLVAAGPLPDAVATGMAVLRLAMAGDLARYARLAQDDDASVTGGLFDVAVRPWDVALAG